MRFLRVLLPALALLVVIAAPVATLAADTSPLQAGWSVIPTECKCENSAPDFRCVGAVIQNLVNLAISIGVVIFVLVVSYAGVLLMGSSVNPGGKEKARSMITNAVIGLLLALAAWLIVDFVMKALYNERFGPWNSILSNPSAKYCLEPRQPAPGAPGAPGTVATGEGTAPDEDKDLDGTKNSEDDDDDGDGIKDAQDNCPTDVNANQADADNDGTGDVCDAPDTPADDPDTGLTERECNPGTVCVSLLEEGSGVPCTRREGNTCLVVPALASRLKNFNDDFAPSWTVYEAFDNAGHSNSCHAAGTCVDFDFLNNATPSASQISSFISTARSNNLYACWEVPTTERRQQLISQGLSASSVDTVAGVGEHASMYMSAPSGGTCNRGSN